MPHGRQLRRRRSGVCSSCHTSRYQNATPTTRPPAGEPVRDVPQHVDVRGRVRSRRATRFALTGAHAATACLSLPPTASITASPTDCASCHELQYGSATPSPRRASPPRSARRATTVTWSGGRFDHGTTAFALTGAHQSSTCNSCHSDNVFGNGGKPAQCETRHSLDYANATPNHAASGFLASLCTTCHNTVTFAGATFNHSNTSFARSPARRSQTVSCNSCHSDGIFDGKPTNCYSCHQSDYSGAVVNHAAAGFQSSACTSCPATTTWTSATFNHTTGTTSRSPDRTSRAPATTATRTTSSTTSPTNCYSCHAADYAGATPNHPAAGFSTASCANCHNTTTSTGAVFQPQHEHELPADRRAPGGGLHELSLRRRVQRQTHGLRLVPHGRLQRARRRTTRRRVSRRARARTATRRPRGRARRSTTPRTRASPDRRAPDGHVQPCHSTACYDGKPTTCQSCHMSDYSGAPINPMAAGFAARPGATCHTTTTWANAPYNHSATSFPLTGAHVSATCVSCHRTASSTTTRWTARRVTWPTTTRPRRTTRRRASRRASLRELPQHDDVHGRDVQSLHEHELPAHRRTRRSRNQLVPRRRRVRRQTDGLLRVPPERLHRRPLNHTTAGFASRRVRDLSHGRPRGPARRTTTRSRASVDGAHTTATCVSCHSNGVQQPRDGCYSCHTDD